MRDPAITKMMIIKGLEELPDLSMRTDDDDTCGGDSDTEKAIVLRTRLHKRLCSEAPNKSVTTMSTEFSLVDSDGSTSFEPTIPVWSSERFDHDEEMQSETPEPPKLRTSNVERSVRFRMEDLEQESSPRLKRSMRGHFRNDFMASVRMNKQQQRPHPACENNMLYEFARRYPRVLTLLEPYYSIRRKMSYPFENRIPGSRPLRKFGIFLTFGELFVILPLAFVLVLCIFYTVWIPNVSITGRVSRGCLLGCVISANRNSFFTFLLGIPVDRARLFHKLSGRMAWLTGVLHTVAYYRLSPRNSQCIFCQLTQDVINTSGTGIFLLMTIIGVSSIPALRRLAFEFFYYTHCIMTLGIAGCAFFHSGIFVPIMAAGTLGVDLFWRYCYQRGTKWHANLRIVSESVVELSIVKTDRFSYNPGQFAYICIPEISRLQYHPFSMSSSPKQCNVTFHIRKTGNWTDAAYKLAMRRKSIEVRLEGPYGNVGLDFSNPDRYRHVLMISGGIGVTPMQSICNQLLYDHMKERRQLKKLSFIWIERDPVLVQRNQVVSNSTSALFVSETSPADLEFSSGQALDLATQLFARVPAGLDDDEELERQYEIEDQSLNESTFFEVPTEHMEQQEMAPPSQNFLPGNDVFDLQIYLTNTRDATSTLPGARIGRPNIRELFMGMKRQAMESGSKRVGVCVAAPKKLIQLCKKACVVYSDKNVRFDIHAEEQY